MIAPLTPYSIRLHNISRHSGLSLIELLIAMALGLLLTLGVTQIYLSSSVTYRQTQGFAHAQESSRFVSAVLTPALRTAGSFGCLARMGRPLDQVIDNRLNNALTITVPLAQAVQGWEYTGTGFNDSISLDAALATPSAGNWTSGAGSTGTNLPASLAGNVVTYSDVIVINAITPVEVPVNAATIPGETSISLDGASGIGKDNVVLATNGATGGVASGDCAEGELFKNDSAPGDSSVSIAGGNSLNLNYDADSRVYEFTTMAYYIGQGTSGEPALFRLLMPPTQPSSPTGAQELVSGVETLQILYGINDDASSNAADNYVTADQVTDWDLVVSVQFSVLTRSPDNVLDEENNRSFSLFGTEVAQGNNGDRRARLASTVTAALRGEMQ